MLTVFGTRASRTFRVLWALEELGLAYTFEETRPQSDAMLAVNPLGQAPAMRDGDTILTDSLAILNYLADRAGALTYQPGAPERAVMDARINFVLTELESPVWQMARHGFVLPKEHRVPGMRKIAEVDIALGETKLAMLLGNDEFIAGNQFTIADIVAGHTLNWIEGAKTTLAAPLVKAYLSRMRDRHSWKRASGDRSQKS